MGRIVLIVLLFVVNFAVYAQKPDDSITLQFFFGDEQKAKINVESLASLNGQVMCVQNNASFLHLFSKNKWQYSFDVLENYTFPKLKPIHFFGNGKTSSLVNYTLLGNNILAISYRSSFSGREPSLYYHRIDPAAKAKNNYGTALNQFTAVHGLPDVSNLSMRSSADGQYASVLYEPKNNKLNNTTFELALFKNDFSSPIEKRFSYPFPSDQFKVIDFVVNDSASQVLITGHYLKNDIRSKNKINQRLFQTLSLNFIQDQATPKLITIESPGVFFLNAKVTTTDSTIVVSGMYTTNNSGRVAGIMTAAYDKEGNALFKTFDPVDELFHQTMSSILQNKIYEESRQQSESGGFVILGVYPVNDGVVQVAEYQALEYRYSAGDFYGGTSSVDTYFWSNNLIVSKVNASGQLVFVKIIPKIQRSVNDNGYYLSTAIYVKNNNMHLFFNGNSENYDSNHKYRLLSDVPKPASLSKTKNTIVHAFIDLSSGRVWRESTVGREDMDVAFVPQLSVAVPEQNKLIIYGRRGNKQRLGVLNFYKK